MSMRLVRFDHVQLAMPVGREPEAIAFYVGVLGLRHVPKPPLLATRGGCWFENDSLKVHLGVEDDFRPARKAHPAFAVEALDVLLRTLAEACVEVRIGDVIDGVAQRFFDDPFGNRIEVMAA